MAQFRVEFLLDEQSGKYLAELYNPDNSEELLVRTEALYPTQAAAVLGVVNLFKNAILKFPPADQRAKVKKAKKPRKAKAAKTPAKAKKKAKGGKKAAKKAAKKRRR